MIRVKESIIGDLNLLREMNNLIYHGNDVRPVWAGAGIPVSLIRGFHGICSWAHMHWSMYFGFVIEYMVKKTHDKLDILDAACGAGHGTVTLADLFPNSHLVGLDLSKPCIEFCNKYNTLPNTEYVCGDAITHKYNQKFDYIFCLETLEHVLAIEHCDLVNNMLSHLKDDGLLFLTTPTNHINAADDTPEHGGHIGTLNVDRAFKFFEAYEDKIIASSFYNNKQLGSPRVSDYIIKESKETFGTRTHLKSHFRFIMRNQ